MAVDTPGRALLDFSSGNIRKVSLLLTCGMPSLRLKLFTAIMPGGYITYWRENLTEICPTTVLRKGLPDAPQGYSHLSLMMRGHPDVEKPALDGPAAHECFDSASLKF
jgi:hypothetical protein